MNELKRLPKEGYGFIYKCTVEDGKQYIGQTTSSIKERMRQHEGRSERGWRMPLFDRVLKKGLSYDVEIISEVPIDMLDAVERYCIGYFDTLVPNGYNMMIGGQTNRIYTDETRRRMRESAKKVVRVITDEHRRKLIEGYQRYCDERPGTKESRKLSNRAKSLRHGQGRKILCLETGKVYDCLTMASEDTGISSRQFSPVLNGKRTTLYGKHWIDYSDYASENPDEVIRCLEEWKETCLWLFHRTATRTYYKNYPNGIKTNSVAIRCLETGEVFIDAVEASKSLGISKYSIYCHMRPTGRRSKSASGYHFERL